MKTNYELCMECPWASVNEDGVWRCRQSGDDLTIEDVIRADETGVDVDCEIIKEAHEVSE